MPKGAQMGVDFWLSIKSVSSALSSCCFVCAFIIGQYHSGSNMSSKSGAAGEIFIFESATEFNPWKRTRSQWVLSMLLSMYMTNQNITSVTNLYRGDIALHSAYSIDHHKVLILESEAPKCSAVERYMCWNVSWPASVDNLVKKQFSLLSKLYPHHCGMSLHQAPMFYFTAK